MTNHQYLSHLLINSISILLKCPQELQNSHLKKRVLYSTNLVLNVMFLSNQSISTSYLGNQIHHSRSIGFVTLNHVLQKSQTTQKHPMTLFLQTSRHFVHKLVNVLRNSFHDFNWRKDSFLTDIGRTAANTLNHQICTLSTSRCRSLASSAVQISLRTQSTRPTMLLLLQFRSILILFVAIINSSDFSWKSWVSPAWCQSYQGSRSFSQ